MEEPTASNQKQSKFNSTISQLMRIDELWKDAHRHSRTGRAREWNADLDRVFCELSEDTKEEDDKKFIWFNKELSKINISSPEASNLLLLKEIFIRRLQNRQGKGTAYQDSMEEYMSD